jgi:hypothetical protein
VSANGGSAVAACSDRLVGPSEAPLSTRHGAVQDHAGVHHVAVRVVDHVAVVVEPERHLAVFDHQACQPLNHRGGVRRALVPEGQHQHAGVRYLGVVGQHHLAFQGAHAGCVAPVVTGEGAVAGQRQGRVLQGDGERVLVQGVVIAGVQVAEQKGVVVLFFPAHAAVAVVADQIELAVVLQHQRVQRVLALGPPDAGQAVAGLGGVLGRWGRNGLHG